MTSQYSLCKGLVYVVHMTSECHFYSDVTSDFKNVIIVIENISFIYLLLILIGLARKSVLLAEQLNLLLSLEPERVDAG